MKSTLITAVIALIIGLGLGSQLLPKIKLETKEVEKEVIVKNIVTVTKIITKPDGTKEEVTTVTDKTKENSSKVSTKKVLGNDWHGSLSARTDSWALTEITYGISIERRILGDVYVGVNANTKREFGVSVGMGF